MTSTDPRRTRQRAAIFSYLRSTAGFQTAQQIFEHLRDSGEYVSLPTVYRTLALMEQSGQVDVLTIGDQAMYRHCSDTHHHHLVCRSCGLTIELTDDPIEQWAAQVGQTHGFTGITHITEFSGLCPECSHSEAACADTITCCDELRDEPVRTTGRRPL